MALVLGLSVATFAHAEQRALLQFQPGLTLDQMQQVLQQQGLHIARHLGYLPGTFEVRGESIDADRLAALPQVAQLLDLRRRERSVRLPDPLQHLQWNLDNQGQAGSCSGHDLGLQGVSEDGSGVVIAVVDDGVEIGHEDLVARSAPMDGLHYDYNDWDNDPTGGEHGTSVAGVALATAGNGLGVRGVAPGANLLGVRLLGGFITAQDEADALTHLVTEVAVSNNSWGLPDDSQYTERLDLLVRSALAYGVENGRGGLGTLYIWAGGNGGESQNANFDPYAGSLQGIAVAATNECGLPTYYSEPGANILVNAPSSDDWQVNIVSTDRSGILGYDESNYTFSFGGTSASAPEVAGVVALMLEANPQLTWRDVRRILATTATRNDPTHAEWQQNAAGYWFNPWYGFGRVDAAAAVSAARSWPPQRTTLTREYVASALGDVPVGIIPTGGSPLTTSIDIPANYALEDVQMHLYSDHADWSELSIALVSPAGTRSWLAWGTSGQYLGNYSDGWPFLSHAFYGETSQGTWTLEVRDEDPAGSGSGRLLNWTLTINGRSLAELRGDVAPLGAPDDRVSVADALLVLRIALGLVQVDADVLAEADVAPNGAPDGRVSVADALLVLRIALGLIE